jgi:hypothetical protein
LSFASLKFQVQFGAGVDGEVSPADRTEVMPLVPESGIAEAAIDSLSENLDEFPLPEL